MPVLFFVFEKMRLTVTWVQHLLERVFIYCALVSSDIEICLRNNKVYFIGDLKLHKLYHTLEERLRNQSLMEIDDTVGRKGARY